ncbi:hypothetical protein BGW39_003229, partial [Mortierella sp. 14UC]
VEFGGGPNVWRNLATVLERVVKDGLDPEQVEQLMLIFRIIRNSAAGVPKNQDQARLAGLSELIQEVVSQAAHTHYGNAGLSALTIEVFKELDKGGVGELHEDGQVTVRAKVKSGNDAAEEDVNEEIEQRAEIVPVPDWVKAQHMTMVNGGRAESAIEPLRLAHTVTMPVNSYFKSSPSFLAV